jgi:Aminoglycoside-2''-adenylyltransferase
LDGGMTIPAEGEPEDGSAWDAWHPAEITERLRHVSSPWYVAGGWSIDLHRGGQVREHEDLEIAVPRERFGEIREALAGFDFVVVGDGRRWPADEPCLDRFHQTWVRDPASEKYRLDVFREPHDGDTWICRRDETLRLPCREIVLRTGGGIPYLVPQVALLFKAKAVRDKDVADFEGVLPLLTAQQRAWLATALDLVHPGHAWTARLG